MTVTVNETTDTITVVEETETVVVQENKDTVEIYDSGLVGYSSGSSFDQNLFIQNTAPVGVTGAYLWIDTTGGNLNFWVETGV